MCLRRITVGLRRRIPSLGASFIACLFVCAVGGANGQSSRLAPVGKVVPYWRFEAPPGFGLPMPIEVVVASDSEWKALWAAATSSLAASPQAPSVDFSRELVVVVGMGRQPSTGYSISAVPVYGEQGVEIRVTKKMPGKNCGSAPAETSPTEMIRIAKGNSPTTFSTQIVQRDCET